MGSYRLQGAASPHPPVLLLSIEYHAKSYQKLRHFILPLKKFWDKCNTKDAFTATSWPGKQRHDPSWSHPGKATKNNILSHLIWTDYHSHITFAIPHCPPQSLCTHNPHLQLLLFICHLIDCSESSGTLFSWRNSYSCKISFKSFWVASLIITNSS